MIPIVTAIPSSVYSDVLIVTNTNSQDSIDISNAFILSRNITRQVNISVSTSESVSFTTFNTSIRQPIETYLNANGITNVNYIVLTKGIPIRYNSDTNCRVGSVDSTLTIILSSYSNNICAGTSTFSGRTLNPGFNNLTKINKTYTDIYMVSRLDGYTKVDAINLFNRSENNTFNATNGRYLYDAQPSKTGGYATWNTRIGTAHTYLNQTILVPGEFNNATTFIGNRSNISSYYSWGSNDGSGSSNSSTWNLSFNYGSYGDTAVSTSARSFLNTTTYGQSLIADLVRFNITVVKGYTNEPYLSAISYPEIVSNRIYNNFSLIESMYMGSKYINWMDIYIGDPKIINIDVRSNTITTSPDTNITCSSDYSDIRFTCTNGGCYYMDSNCEANFTNSNRKYTCTTSTCV
jgi:uncharacterized protein (TIGR03790 family)